MTQMEYLINLKLIIVLSLSFFNCNSSKMSDTKANTIYYKDFNIFKLEGTGTLDKLNKKGSVEVRYSNEVPTFIKYYKKERTIELKLEDSFDIKVGKSVFVYSTSNFHGGKPGRHRVYGTHTEEYKDVIYVSLTDTLICKSYEVPASKNYDYALYMYIANSDGTVIKHQSGRNSEADTGILNEKLYQVWLDQLTKSFISYKHPKIIVRELPE